MSAVRDTDFLPSTLRAESERGNSFAYILTLMVFVFVGFFIYWASIATLEEVTRGEATVIPSQRVQVIQNLEGGILAEMLVREGDIVDKGEVLLRIENTAAQAQFKENQGRIYSLAASTARLQAEAEGKPLEFPQDLVEAAPGVVASERETHELRVQELEQSVAGLESEKVQRSQEIQELQSRRDQLADTLRITQRELNLMRPLAPRVVSEREILQLERQVADIEGELRTVQLSIPRAEAALEQANHRLEEVRFTFKREASERLSQLRAELNALREINAAGEDKVQRTTIPSPVRGKVQQIYFNTIGGVIPPGEDILEIVPLDDTLLVEAQIKPADIAFIRPGQDAKVKITAYDFSIYGSLDAKVENVSPDTDTDEEGNIFYRVHLRTEENTFSRNGKTYPISPGMVATVDILTGEKTVMDYLLKPILKVQENALRER